MLNRDLTYCIYFIMFLTGRCSDSCKHFTSVFGIRKETSLISYPNSIKSMIIQFKLAEGT